MSNSLITPKSIRNLSCIHILIFLGLLFSFTGCKSDKGLADNGNTIIHILYTNDSHGRIFTDDKNTTIAGMDYIAAIKKSMPEALLVDIGDTFHGLPVANHFKGESIVELMNKANYDIMVPGNHDFNYGLPQLAKLASKAKFNIIAANISWQANDSLLFPATVIKQINGIPIGFFGLTTTSTPSRTGKKNVDGLDFKSYTEPAGKAIKDLRRQGARIIICLAHVGRKETQQLAKELGNDIQIIIDGHDHISATEQVGNVLITSSGCYEANIGLITIEYDKQAHKMNRATSSLITAEQVHRSGKRDKKTSRLLENYMATVNRIFGEVIGYSQVLLQATRGTEETPGIRNSEQPIGNLLADALRKQAKTDLAIFNSGNIKSSLSIGNITRANINAMCPHENYLVIKEINGKLLKKILEESVRTAPEPSGGFEQISGFSFTYNPSNPEDSKVTQIRIGNRSIDMDDETIRYTLAVNNFTADGGDGFTMLKEAQTLKEGEALEAIIADYIKSISPLTTSNTGTDNRIQTIK